MHPDSPTAGGDFLFKNVSLNVVSQIINKVQEHYIKEYYIKMPRCLINVKERL